MGIEIIKFFPQFGITIPLAALVGMASMFAGASRALLTSIIFALETTSQSNALLPLLGACLGSYLVSFFLMENTIMTEKIARRGVKTPHLYEPDILERLTVEQVINDFEIVFNEDDSIKKVIEWLSQEINYQSNYFVISNIDGEYKGILSSSILFNNQNFLENKIGTLLKSNNASVRLKDTLRIVAEIMAKENIDVLPVVEENNIVGIVSYRDILASYKHRTDNHEMKKPHISFKREGLKIWIW